MVDMLRNFGTVWYSPSSLANVLSLAPVRLRYRVTIDTGVEPAFLVHKDDGTILKFSEYHNVLYLHDTTDASMKVRLIQIVDGNESMF